MAYIEKHEDYQFRYEVIEKNDVYIIRTTKEPLKEGINSFVKNVLYYKDDSAETDEFDKDLKAIKKSCIISD